MSSLGDWPYINEPEYSYAMSFAKPDIAVLMLGTNDSKRFNWNKMRFKKDASKLVENLLNHFDKVFICPPPPMYQPKEIEMWETDEWL